MEDTAEKKDYNISLKEHNLSALETCAQENITLNYEETNVEEMNKNPMKPKPWKKIDMISEGTDTNEDTEKYTKKNEEKGEDDIIEKAHVGDSSEKVKKTLESRQEEINTAYSYLLAANEKEDICKIGEPDFVENPIQDRQELQKLENDLKVQKKKYAALEVLLGKLEFLQEKVHSYL